MLFAITNSYVGSLLAFVTVTAAIATISKSPIRKPFIYVFQKMVTEPLEHWLSTLVRVATDPIRKEVTLNGGGSLKDAVVDIQARVVKVEDTLITIGDNTK